MRRMSVARFPSLAHWGAYTALVENGRVIGCEPFARDPAPSHMLEAIPAMVHSPLRIARPAIAKAGAKARNAPAATAFARCPGMKRSRRRRRALARARQHSAILQFSAAPMAGRRPGVSIMPAACCADFCFSAAAASIRSPTTASARRNTSCRASSARFARGRRGHGLGVHRQAYAPDDRVRRACAQERPGHVGRRRSAHLETWLRRAKDAGIEFVSISPLKSDAPDFLAAQWIAIRPNTDTALMLALAHTLSAEDRYDAQFVARYCIGFETFRRYLLGVDDGAAKNADWAAAITGVPPRRSAISRAAPPAHRTMITCTWSLQRAHHGEQPYWASIVLAADARR